jgi:hypothetical protein
MVFFYVTFPPRCRIGKELLRKLGINCPWLNLEEYQGKIAAVFESC